MSTVPPDQGNNASTESDATHRWWVVVLDRLQAIWTAESWTPWTRMILTAIIFAAIYAGLQMVLPI